MGTIMCNKFLALVLSALMTTAVVTTPAAAQDSAQAAEGIRYVQIPEGAYSIVAEVRARPGKEAELREATLPLVALVRNDPKNLVYFLQENRAAPGHFVFCEIFATRADFEAHNAMSYVKDWLAKLPALAQEDVQIMRMQVLGHGQK